MTSRIRTFIDAYAALILRLARLSVGTTSSLEAGDVAHEVIVSLLHMHQEGSLDPDQLREPEAYLRVVVRHAAQRAQRRSQRAGELTSEGHADQLSDHLRPAELASETSPEELTREARDARRTLDALKQRLRPRDAVAFTLLVEDGLSIEQTAEALGTTPNNVYQMRHRILAAARELTSLESTSPSPSGECP